MLKEVVKYIQDTAQEVEQGRDQFDREVFYVPQNFNLQLTIPPLPSPIKVATLTGLVTFCTKMGDRLDDFIVHVENYHSVRVVGKLDPTYKTRPVYAVADCGGMAANGFPFDKWIGLEDFKIALMTNFVRDESAKELLRFVGNIKSERINENADDGVSQKVTLRKSLTQVGTETVPNPVVLAPIVTFSEIKQPDIPLVFRLKESGEKDILAGLFMPPGVTWEAKCLDRIVEFFEVQLINVVIG